MEDEGLKTNDKPWLFKKGNPGGPGRPKGSGKSLKEYSREFLANMTDEERMDFLDGLPKEVIWKMSEGNPESNDKLKVTPEIGDAPLIKELNDSIKQLIRERNRS